MEPSTTGEVWEPPHRLVYQWHIYGDRSEATRVEITFLGSGDTTTMRVRHTGWARLGAKGAELRGRNQGGWANLLRAYAPAATG